MCLACNLVIHTFRLAILIYELLMTTFHTKDKNTNEMHFTQKSIFNPRYKLQHTCKHDLSVRCMLCYVYLFTNHRCKRTTAFTEYNTFQLVCTC